MDNSGRRSHDSMAQQPRAKSIDMQKIAEHAEAAQTSSSRALHALALETQNTVKMLQVQGKEKERTRKLKLNTYQRVQEPLKTWLMFDENGNMSRLEKEKLVIANAFGVTLRDLRLLDPHLAASYPSAILSRENCLVVSLEHIKCLIGTNRVLVYNVNNEAIVPFVEELQRRLHNHFERFNDPLEDSGEAPYELAALEVALESIAKHMEGLAEDIEQKAHFALDTLTSVVNSLNLQRLRNIKSQLSRLTTRVETMREVLEKYLESDDDMQKIFISKRLELENSSNDSHRALTDVGVNLKRLEAEDMGQYLVGRLLKTSMSIDRLDHKLNDKLAASKAKEAPAPGPAHPPGVVSGLVSRRASGHALGLGISQGRLTRAGREAMERLLEGKRSFRVPAADANGRAPSEPAGTVPSSYAQEDDDGAADGPPPHSPLPLQSTFTSKKTQRSSRKHHATRSSSSSSSTSSGTSSQSSSSRSSSSRSSSSYRSEVESMIEEVEELLEGYFLNIDQTWNKLRTLSQLIEDTEDYITIELDMHRNQLVAIDLVVTIATFSATLVAAVASIFGQNLVSPYMPDVVGLKKSIYYFKLVTGLSSAVAISLFVGLLLYVKKRKLLPGLI